MCCGNTSNTGCNGGCNDRCNDPCNKCQPSRCECLVRYSGPDIDCLGVTTDDSFETVISKVAGFVCDLNFEDGVNGNYTNVVPEPAGANCEYGGVLITLYNGQTNAVISTNYVCNTECECEEPIPLQLFYGNTLFVDEIFGNDLTAVRERFNYPYRNIQTAINAAQAGDTVWVRTGDYTENLILKNLVGLHFEKVTLFGKISNNGVAVKTKIFGGLTIVCTVNNALDITGEGYDISVDITEINSLGTAIYMSTLVEKIRGYMEVNIDRIVGLQYNYSVNVVKAANLTLNVRETIEVPSNSDPSAVGTFVIRVNGNFSGRLHVTCPLVILNLTNSVDGGVLYSDLVSEEGSDGGYVYVNIEEVQNHYGRVDGGSEPFTNFGIINRTGASTAYFNIGRILTLDQDPSRDGIHVKGSVVGPTYFKGVIQVNRAHSVRYASSSPLVIKDSRLKNSSGYYEDTFKPSIIIGNPAGYASLPEGIETGYKFSIEDSVIINDSNDATVTNAIVLKSGVDPIHLKNVDIYGKGIFAGVSVKTDGGTEKDIYFKNTTSNKNIDVATVTNISTGSFDFDATMVVHEVDKA